MDSPINSFNSRYHPIKTNKDIRTLMEDEYARVWYEKLALEAYNTHLA